MDRSGQRFWAFARASARKAFARARALVTEEPDAHGYEDAERVGAEELAKAGGDLRAGVAKLAQLMAYTAGPGAAGDDEARRILGRLWDRAPEADRAAIREVVRKDLGARSHRRPRMRLASSSPAAPGPAV